MILVGSERISAHSFDGKVIRTRFVTSISKEAKILSSAVETVTKLVTPILEEQNFELVEVEFVKEGKIGFYEYLSIKKVALILRNVPLSAKN